MAEGTRLKSLEEQIRRQDAKITELNESFHKQLMEVQNKNSDFQAQMIASVRKTDSGVSSLEAKVDALIQALKKDTLQKDKQPVDEGTSVIEKTPILPTPDSSLRVYSENTYNREKGGKSLNPQSSHHSFHPKIELPFFNGNNPREWLRKCDKFFLVHQIEEGLNKEEDFSGFQNVDNNFSWSDSRKDIEQKVFDKSPTLEQEQLLFEEIPKSDLAGDAKFVNIDFFPSQSLIGQESFPNFMETENLKTTPEEFNATDEGTFIKFTENFEPQDFDGVKPSTIAKCVDKVDLYDNSLVLNGIVEKISLGINLEKVDNVGSLPTAWKDANVFEHILEKFSKGFEGIDEHEFWTIFEGMERVIISIEGDKTIHEVWVEEITKFKGGTTCEYYKIVKLSAASNNMHCLENGFSYDAKWYGIVTKQGSGNSVANCEFGKYNGAQICFFNIYIMQLFGRYLNFMIAEEEEGTCLKLVSKYYGPYQVLEKIGEVAYKLKLPPQARFHPIFHVSLLKKQVGPQQVVSTPLPELDNQDYCLLQPAVVLQRRIITRGQKQLTQWLVQWTGLTPEEASWEDQSFIQHQFPEFKP